jgi:Ni/Fe-hydrogenase 1 B-type cytochrome subunit
MVTTHFYNRIFVWEVPVRIFHWLNVLSIFVLSITGYLIGDPPALMSSAEATNQYYFGIVRFIHFATAYIFLIGMIYRIAWSFLGNKYASWKVFFPLSKMSFKDTLHVVKDHIFLQNAKLYDFRKNFVGHNPVAAWSYALVFILMFVQVFTGFALYADNATWWLPKMFGWIPALLGGDFNVRFIHHIVMWAFVVFSVIHIYLSLWHDWLEGRGEVSSMIGGYKFIRKERYDEKRKEAGLDPLDCTAEEDETKE